MSRDDHEHDEAPLLDDISIDPKNLTIYSGRDTLPSGFTSKIVTIDLSPNASLDLKEEKMLLNDLISKSIHPLIEISTGLDPATTALYPHNAFLQSLLFALDYLRDHLLPLYHTHLAGIILGRVQLPLTIPHELEASCADELGAWSKDLLLCDQNPHIASLIFQRDIIADYVQLLADRITGSINRILLLDTSTLITPAQFALATARDRFHGIQLAIKNPLFYVNNMVWDEGSFGKGFIGNTLPNTLHSPHAPIAFLLPSSPRDSLAAYPELEQAMNYLTSEKIDFRAIPEEFLTQEWDGLETLVVSSSCTSSLKRKLAGFEAAGGTIIEASNIKEIAP